MAEIVQQNLESMLPELEQIQRVQLLSEVEVKQLIKQRKKLEYRLQKREKRKEDFLEYIQYELALMALLEMRREKTGYFHKKDEIEYAIAKRINRMFRIIEHRFGHDIKIWLSHIDFLKKMKWDSEVGRIYRRMLKVHVHEVGLWVAAAKYEMEECGRAENARQVMFEALRFHPKSHTLYREYFRLELIYVEQLRKRASVLGGDLQEVVEDHRDQVLKGEVAKIVFSTASEVIPDASFLASLIPIAAKFDFASQLIEHIESHLKTNFGDSAAMWNDLGRSFLVNPSQGSSILAQFKKCIEIYDEGLASDRVRDKLKLVHFFVETLGELWNLVASEGKNGEANNDGAVSEKFMTTLSRYLADKQLKVLQEAREQDWFALEGQDKQKQHQEDQRVHVLTDLLTRSLKDDIGLVSCTYISEVDIMDDMKWSDGGTGTKKHYTIEGPYRTHQWRVGLTSEFQEADRLWRKQYLKDQVLSPKDLYNDMDRIPEYRKARYNFIRRIARMPGDAFEGVLRGFMSPPQAVVARFVTTRGLAMWALGVGVAFYFTTQESDWTRNQGMRILDRQHAIYPGHPEWPHNTSQKREKPSDFGNRGFEHSPI